jgi:CoA:oxalate CoA-transferase
VSQHPPTPADAPLAGIRVLDLTRVLSGPHTTRMLADLGAEVIKIEPPDGDLTRFSNPRVGSMATYFVQQNAGKANVSVDLTTSEGREILLRLAEASDVVIENYRGDVMTRLGLAPSVLLDRNPRLVVASITGYGQTGPWVRRRAYATVVGAESGLTRAQGDARARTHPPAEHQPRYTNDDHSHADVYTALECASAVLAALFQRERTGRGQHVEVSMADTMLYVNEHAHDHLFDGDVDDSVIRSFRPADYPVLTVADGTAVVISGHPAERGTFDRFVAAMGRPDLLADDRLADVAGRLEHLGEIAAALERWAASVPDAETCERILAEQGLAVGRLRSYREMAETEWARERGAIVDVPDRQGGTVRIPDSPWRFGAATTGVRGEPRFRGEDNALVLGALLGMSADEIDDLETRGVLSSRVPPVRESE